MRLTVTARIGARLRRRGTALADEAAARRSLVRNAIGAAEPLGSWPSTSMLGHWEPGIYGVTGVHTWETGNPKIDEN